MHRELSRTPKVPSQMRFGLWHVSQAWVLKTVMKDYIWSTLGDYVLYLSHLHSRVASDLERCLKHQVRAPESEVNLKIANKGKRSQTFHSSVCLSAL